MTVYVDALFLMNFIFDAQLLFILCKIYSKKASAAKILLSAVSGGLMGVLAFVPYFTILLWPPTQAAFSVLMVFGVFYPCRPKQLLGAATAFLGIAFATAGAMSFFECNGLVIMPILIYLPIVAIKKNIKKGRMKTILVYKGKMCEEEGFSDSGNMLSYGGCPVLVGSESVFKRLLGDGFNEKGVLEWADKRDVRIIPYRALGKSGAVLGIRLDYAEVCGKRYYGAILAYCDEKISENLILNSAML